MKVLLFLGIIVVAIIWFIFVVNVWMWNINDIASYYQQGQPAPFWPFFWLALTGAISGTAGAVAK